ncbi:MaoC family dehydratase [Desulfocurvus sp. DL9XJH121]
MSWTFASLEVGSSDSISKVITAADVEGFAGITLDNNPVHLNEEYAQGTMFKHRIAHGMISAGLISAVLGTRLPGNGTIYMKQELIFKRPVYLDEELTAHVEVAEKIEAKKRLRLKTWVTNQAGDTVTDGEALVMFDA